MPKNAQYVEYNHEGDWVFALIMREASGPGNYDLLTDKGEQFGNVPKGTESGHWREPK